MINCYCRQCGLYISVPDDFGGGKGSCPRCKTQLRIPKPLPADMPDYEEGIRYVAEPIGSPRAMSETPDVVRPQLGPSVRYRCEHCGDGYESLKSPKWEQGLCPRCGTVNKQVIRSVVFPRPARRVKPHEDRNALGGDETVAQKAQADADAADARIEKDAPIEIRDGFLVASKARRIPDGAEIIDGRPLGQGEALDGDPDIAGAMPTDMEAQEPEETTPPADVDEGEALWQYLLQGKKHGPVSEAKLMRLLAGGQISPSVMVFREGMAGWHPLEDVEALAQGIDRVQAAEEAQEAAEPPAPLPPVSVRSTREISDACARLMWLFLTGACLTVLLAVTQDTFHFIGRGVLLATGLALGVAQALAACYGIATVSQNFKVFRRLPVSVRTQAMAGIGGLAAAGAIAIAVAVLAPPQPPRGPVITRDPDIHQAQIVFNAFTTGNDQLVEANVNLNELVIDGKSMGEQFRAVGDDADARNRLIWLLFGRFERRFNPKQLSAEQLEQWRIVGRGRGSVTVAADRPDQADTSVILEFQGGLLTRLTLQDASASTQPGE